MEQSSVNLGFPSYSATDYMTILPEIKSNFMKYGTDRRTNFGVEYGNIPLQLALTEKKPYFSDI